MLPATCSISPLPEGNAMAPVINRKLHRAMREIARRRTLVRSGFFTMEDATGPSSIIQKIAPLVLLRACSSLLPKQVTNLVESEPSELGLDEARKMEELVDESRSKNGGGAG